MFHLHRLHDHDRCPRRYVVADGDVDADDRALQRRPYPVPVDGVGRIRLPTERVAGPVGERRVATMGEDGQRVAAIHDSPGTGVARCPCGRAGLLGSGGRRGWLVPPGSVEQLG